MRSNSRECWRVSLSRIALSTGSLSSRMFAGTVLARITTNLKDAKVDGEFTLSGLSSGGDSRPSSFSTGSKLYPGSQLRSRSWWNPGYEEDFSKSLGVNKEIEKTELLAAEVDCKGKASVKSSLSISGKAQLLGKVGIYIRGTLWGGVKEAYVYTLLDGEISGAVDLSFSAEGHFDTDEISLFMQGIPGLSFGKIFTVGPAIELLARADGALKLTANMSYEFEYKMQQTLLRFPKNRAGNFDPKPETSPLNMKLDQSIEAHGYIRGHIIPRLTLTITAFEARADLIVDIDASMKAEVTAWAARSKSLVPIGDKADSKTASSTPAGYKSTSAGRTVGDMMGEWDEATRETRKMQSDSHYFDNVNYKRSAPPTPSPTPSRWRRKSKLFPNVTSGIDKFESSVKKPEANSEKWNTTYGGHFILSTTLDVRAGASLKSGAFLGIFLDKLGVGRSLEKTFTLVSKTFGLYELKWPEEAKDGATHAKRSEVYKRLPAGKKGNGPLPIKIPGLGCSFDVTSEAKTKAQDGLKSLKDEYKTIKAWTSPKGKPGKRDLAEF
ncbi:hypothetical protein HGRIS_013941 [Hohenbuehelia grisea]